MSGNTHPVYVANNIRLPKKNHAGSFACSMRFRTGVDVNRQSQSSPPRTSKASSFDDEKARPEAARS